MTCHSGTRSRQRRKTRKAKLWRPCNGDSTEREICVNDPPIDCVWDQWSPWNDAKCYEPCGRFNMKARFRRKTVTERCSVCNGDNFEIQLCGLPVCPPPVCPSCPPGK